MGAGFCWFCGLIVQQGPRIIDVMDKILAVLQGLENIRGWVYGDMEGVGELRG